MYSCNGGHLGIDEARSVLASFGPLSKCEQLDAQTQDSMSLGAAVLIEFTTFDPARDIQAVSEPIRFNLSLMFFADMAPVIGIPPPSPLPCHSLRSQEVVTEPKS